MGKHRFRLSDLTPNSWFYKLKDMSKSNTSHTTSMNKWNYNTQAISVTPKPIPSQPYLPNIVSYYLSTNDKPNKLPIKTNPKAIDIPFPIDPPKKINPNSVKKPAKSSFSSMPKTPPYDRDIYTEEDICNNSEIKLRPIRTKGLERENLDDQPSSPRLRSRRLRVYKTRNPALRGFAVVKASFDPQRDFRESMMEMITENRIRNPKDLEELLTCYLMLNSMEYHGIIVKVFENIWIELDC